jgi:Cu/Ag efflux protein CusF
MKPAIRLALVAAALAAAPVFAQQPSMSSADVKATAPGQAAAASVVTASATVTAIDPATRAVTLKGPLGNTFRVIAGKEVKNFDQIKVGDEVVVTHVEALTLALKKGGDGIRERVVSTDSATAKPGERPAGAVGGRITVVANVIAVNKRAQTVTLRGVENTVELRVKDPNQLKLIKVGDQVQATYTEAVAIAVEPAKK